MKVTQGRSITQVPGHWREVDTPSKKRGRVEEAQGRNNTQALEDWRKKDTKSGRVEEAQGRNITQVGGDWRRMDTPSEKRKKMEETQEPNSGCVTERKLVDNLKKRDVDCV